MKQTVKAVFLFAMQDEADAFLSATNAQLVHHVGAMELFVFTIARSHFGVVRNGKSARHRCDRIGTEAAMLSAHIAHSFYDTDWLISAGTCGAFDARLNIGDIIAASPMAVFYDHRVPLPEFDGYSKGEYPLYLCQYLQEDSTVFKGTVATGHSLDMSPRCETMLKSLSAAAKEMELAAVAQYADEFGLRASGLKVVSNPAGDQGHEAFSDNLVNVSERLSSVLYRWCTQLAAN